VKTTTVFFRDDDVGELTPSLRAIVELLIDERIPCNYAVVPSLLTEEAARYMRDAKKQHPTLVYLNQHGFLHQQIIEGRFDYAEFDGDRPYREQYDAIAEGRRVLIDMLGDDFDPDVFCPPCHKYDATTLRALAATGFRVLSAGVYSQRSARMYYDVGRVLSRVHFLGRRVSYHEGRKTPHGLLEISTAINVDEDYGDDGRRREKNYAELVEELVRAREQYRYVGVLLHHQTYEDAPARLNILKEFVHTLRRDPTIQFSAIEPIAAQLGAPVRVHQEHRSHVDARTAHG
jgi:hypothetical protein